MPSINDLRRAWLLRTLGLSSSTLSEADLLAKIYNLKGHPNNAKFKSGLYYSTNLPSATIGSTALPVNGLYLVPFNMGEGATLVSLALRVTAAGGAGSVIRLGIYDDVDGIPTNRLLDAGTVDSSVAGNKEIVINQSFDPGMIWLGAVAQVGTAPTVSTVGSGNCGLVGLAALSDIEFGYASYLHNGVAGALPAAIAPVANFLAPRIFAKIG